MATPEQNRINGKLGGRPKGVKNQATIEREKALEAFNNRVYSIADSLLNSQQSLAKGQQFLFRIDTVHTKGPKGGDIKTKQKPVLVTDEEEIRTYIDSLNDPYSNIDEDTYYYITTKEPSNMAIDSLMNRAFGKPKESVELIGEMKLKVDF